MEPNQLLKTTIPLISLGNRTFALYSDQYTDKKGVLKHSSILGEVEAVADPEKPTTVKGFKPKFQGSRIQGEPAAMAAFLKALAKVV